MKYIITALIVCYALLSLVITIDLINSFFTISNSFNTAILTLFLIVLITLSLVLNSHLNSKYKTNVSLEINKLIF